MLTLGEQLVLLALDADKGAIRGSQVLQFGLNAAGLAELLERGLIKLRRPDGAFGVTPVEGAEETEFEDPVLSAVWKQLRSTPEGHRHPDLCVRNWREPSLYFYLKALRSRDVLAWNDHLARPWDGRISLLDPDAAATALARVDRVRTGADPDAQDRNLAGVVHGLGFGKVVYPGIRGRARRAALEAAVAKQRFALILARALPPVRGQELTIESSGYAGVDLTNYPNI